MYVCIVEDYADGSPTMEVVFTGTREECVAKVTELYASEQYKNCVAIHVEEK